MDTKRQIKERLFKEVAYKFEKQYYIIYDEGVVYDGCNQQVLAVVYGFRDIVIDYALTLDRFQIWGNGGDIKEIEVIKIDIVDAEKRIILINKKEKLRKELEEVEKELNG